MILTGCVWFIVVGKVVSADGFNIFTGVLVNASCSDLLSKFLEAIDGYTLGEVNQSESVRDKWKVVHLLLGHLLLEFVIE